MPKIYRVMFTLKDRFHVARNSDQRGQTSEAMYINQYFAVSSAEQMKQIFLTHKAARNGQLTQAELDQALENMSNTPFGTDELEVINQQRVTNLAEFLDFGQIGFQQMQALGEHCTHMFEAIALYNEHIAFANQDYNEYTQHIIDSRLPALVFVSMVKAAIKSKH